MWPLYILLGILLAPTAAVGGLYLSRIRFSKRLVALTKADKLGKSQRKLAAQAARKLLGLRRDPLMVSASTNDGLDELWKAIRAAVTQPAPVAPPAPT